MSGDMIDHSTGRPGGGSDVSPPCERLSCADPEIHEILIRETGRQREGLELIASEKFV
jgi:hypothetical protein